MPADLRERIASDIRTVVDSMIEDRLMATGQILNLGGPTEFAQSIDEQRSKIAAFAAELGFKPSH